MDEPLSTFEYVLPRWQWHMNLVDFTWSPSLQLPLAPKLPKAISLKIGALSLNFSQDNCSPSFLELVYYAWFAGIRLEGEKHTPAHYCTIFKKVFNQIPKVDPQKFATLPAEISTGSLSSGHIHPRGVFKGAKVFQYTPSLCALACSLQRRKQGLKAWNVPF